MVKHAPLPYVVRLRHVAHEDAPPVSHERRVVAYDVIEAVTQALVEISGSMGVDTGKYHIESVGPDLEAFPKFLEHLAGAAAR